MEPNTRKELAIDMQGLAFSGQSSHLAACSTVTALRRNLARGQPQQGEHLTQQCKHWSSVSDKEPEAQWRHKQASGEKLQSELNNTEGAN